MFDPLGSGLDHHDIVAWIARVDHQSKKSNSPTLDTNHWFSCGCDCVIGRSISVSCSFGASIHAVCCRYFGWRETVVGFAQQIYNCSVVFVLCSDFSVVFSFRMVMVENIPLKINRKIGNSRMLDRIILLV